MSKRVASLLRDARRRLETAKPDGPTEQAAVGAVIEVLAREEHALAAANDRAEASSAEQIRELGRKVGELEEALRARDEFLSTVGHGLKNPLSPIYFQAQHILSIVRSAPGGVVAAPAILPRLSAFSQRLERFLATLERITDVSRISSGNVELVLEDVDLGALVRDVAAGMVREIAAARVAISVHVEPGVFGRWDRMRLEQVGHNLLSNAVRYGLGAPIEISVTREDGLAVLRVRDHGVGIDEADQARIFQRFERVTPAPRTGGFGVGLWVVKKLCQALGGEVLVESRLGEGATFIVRLPMTGREIT